MSRSSVDWKGIILTVGVGLALALAGCKAGPTASVPPASATTSAPESSPTAPPQPTATLPPLAATVNGEHILLADFEAELQCYRDANPADTAGAEAQRHIVLDSLIDQALLAQAAVKAGDNLDDAALQERISHLGDAQKVAEWLAANHYTEESFRRALRQSALAAMQRDRITAAVPETAEQVHARQILVQEAATADNLLAQLKNGANFDTLAQGYDLTTGGELGWFPRGTLTQPEVEAAAFELQPEQFSAVIQSDIGYHIIFVVERDANHPLNAEARRALQGQALRSWLEQQRSSSQITVNQP